MIVKSERIAVVLLIAVAAAWVTPAWGQAAKPDLAAKPALTRAEQKLLGEFYQAYALKDDELVKHFGPPFLPGRMVYYWQTESPSRIRSREVEPDSFFFRWKQNKLDCFSGAVFGAGGLYDLIPILLDFDRQEIEGDEELLKAPIRGDWILRDGVPHERLLAGMERVLRTQLQIPVRISIQELDRKVLIAKGHFRFSPISDPKRFEIYTKTIVEKGHGGGSGNVDEFLRGVGQFIDRRIVSDIADPPEVPLRWRYNEPMRPGKMAEGDVEQVLKHVTEQTGLTFFPGVRRVRVVKVEPES